MVNDHDCLREDLEAMTLAGHPIIPLDRLLDALDGTTRLDPGSVCLTFDDGCDFDVRDIDVPGVGRQRSFLGILEDFRQHHGPGVQPGLQATSFVIASAAAREAIDRRSLFGRGWMRDDWWAAACRHPLMAIGNHSLDHHHADIAPEDPGRGRFDHLSSVAECDRQVIDAARRIEAMCGVRPTVFAYPFGESSDFMRESYFPEHASRHGCRAALGDEPETIGPDSDRWNLPRFVCGRDWTSSAGLLQLLRG